MNDRLKLGNNYTVEFLLNFLSENYQKNVSIISSNCKDLLSLPRDKEFVVSDFQQVYLHRFSKPSTYLQNTEAKIYYIEMI